MQIAILVVVGRGTFYFFPDFFFLGAKIASCRSGFGEGTLFWDHADCLFFLGQKNEIDPRSIFIPRTPQSS